VASIYHKKYTQALPKSAETFEKDGETWARWEGRGGVTRMGRLRPGGRRVEMETKTWVARYRDGEGRRREVSTGCRDKAAARQVLADLVKRAEQVRAGIITPQQARTADHADVPVSEHVAAYLQHLEVKTVRGKRVSEHHRKNVRGQLRRLLEECTYHRLADITRESMERWMARAEKTGMAARTRNTYRAAIVAFCNWCVETDRLTANPLDGLCKADVRSDRRRVRRALTEEEIVRLLKAARLRPVATYGRETEPLPPDEREGSSTWQYKDLTYGTLEAAYERGRETLQDSPEFLAQKEWRGRERALIYRTLVLTGLRRGELESITVGQVRLDAERPHLELLAGDSKSGRGALIPLREDLAGDIADWLDEKQSRLQDEAREAGEPIPSRLPFEEPLFYVPSGLIRIFDRDIAAADIPKEDERGRTVDIHALRHTFGTHLSKAGVAPRTAQAAMRHSTIDLTMNIYTDPRLLDVAGAVEALPGLGCGQAFKACKSYLAD
jgi:integrase